MVRSAGGRHGPRAQPLPSLLNCRHPAIAFCNRGLMPDVDLYLHVRVLISMILGLSVARLIGGVAGFIQHPGRDRVWPVHLGWVAWALLNVVTLWWWEFRLSLVAHWTFALYLF